MDGRRDCDASYVCHRLVSREGFLCCQGSRYSAPEHAGRPLLIKEGADGRLRIYSGHSCVAEHSLAQKPGSIVTSPGHADAVRALARAKGRNGEGARPDGHVMPESILL